MYKLLMVIRLRLRPIKACHVQRTERNSRASAWASGELSPSVPPPPLVRSARSLPTRDRRTVLCTRKSWHGIVDVLAASGRTVVAHGGCRSRPPGGQSEAVDPSNAARAPSAHPRTKSFQPGRAPVPLMRLGAICGSTDGWERGVTSARPTMLSSHAGELGAPFVGRAAVGMTGSRSTAAGLETGTRTPSVWQNR